MAHIIEVLNPFKPLDDTRRHVHPGGITIREWLNETFPGFKEFSHPTICVVNGKETLRAEWSTRKIESNDVINFVTIPGDPFTLVYILFAVIVVAAVAVVLSLPKPKIPGETPAPDPVWDIKGQRNQNRLGSPVEVPYGRCRLFPSYAARPYNLYLNNNAYQYTLFCLGQGEYAVETPQYEDTPVTGFADIQYEIYGPGVSPALFPNDVVTSSSVSALEMLGSNEVGFAVLGPFVASPSGTTATLLQIDAVFPAGLYHAASDGTLGAAEVVCLWEYQQIDNSGTPVGGWSPFPTFDKTLATTTPQRFTLEAAVPAARYQVRGQRTNLKQTTTDYGNIVKWDGLRAFLPSTVDFGNVTLIAVKARASNNLNDNSAQRFNVWATRKLPIWDAGTHTWSAVTATRNPTWAFCDVFRATYGGQLLDQFLDLDGLAGFATTFASEGRNFDFVFDQPSTVWEAATAIARVARCAPIPNISQITLVRDTTKTLATAVFTPDNILKGSFSWEIKLANISDYTGVQIEYTDPLTFLPATVDCLVGTDTIDNLEQIKLPGCTDRDFAYREGMYLRQQRLLIRENISFQTELEGHIPTYGDLISVSHDLPRWGTFGRVISIVGTAVTLSEPVTFSGSSVIAFRKKDGSLSGPHACTAGADSTHIVLGATLTDTLFFDGIHELPTFQFGPVDLFSKMCIVNNLQPAENNTVQVSCVPYDSTVFSHDSDTAPSPIGGSTPSDPVLPFINCDSLSQSWEPLQDGKIRIAWGGSARAFAYKVETSSDGTNWSNAGTTAETSQLVDGIPGQNFQFRVTPLGLGNVNGQSCSGGMSIGFKPSSPTPPPPGGQPTYPEYWQPSILIPPSASISVSSKLRGGTASLIGCAPPIGQTSTPWVKYRNAAYSGSITRNQYNGPGCTGGIRGTRTDAFAGTNSYAADGTFTNGATYSLSSGGAPTVTPVLACTLMVLNDTCKETVTNTSTTSTFTDTGACCSDVSLGGPDPSSQGDGHSLVATFSIPDTDADAFSRLDASLPAWSSISWSGGVGATSTWEVRSASYSYDRYQAKIKFSGTAYFANWDYALKIVFEHKLRASSTWVESQTIEYLVPADGSGVFNYEVDVPDEAGYDNRLKSWSFGLE